jgi:hypothetical protein
MPKFIKKGGEELDTRYSSPRESALRMAFNMGRDYIIEVGGAQGSYRGDMFVMDSEKRAYDRGWQQELEDLVSVVRES